MTERTYTCKRADFLSEEHWQRAMREGGTFNLRGGFRVHVHSPMLVRITDMDVDPVDLKWSVSFEPVEPTPAPAPKVDRPNEFWWATVHGHDRPEVVEVAFEDGKPHLVHVAGSDIGIWAYEFEQNQVRLIERVLPAGRAAAVVAKLQEAFDIRDEGAWVTVQKIAELLQGESRAGWSPIPRSLRKDMSA